VKRYLFVLISFLLCLQDNPVLADSPDTSQRVQLLFFGDINLGRTVGQKLLQGATDFPFAEVRGRCNNADIVFGNLESIISDQNGETVSPTSNIVFCAPPIAAEVLRDTHFAVLSLANNHTFDYGVKGIQDACASLDDAGVAYTGIIPETSAIAPPVIIEKNGIRIGFVAYTKVLNFQKGKRYVAFFDSVRAHDDIVALQPQVDFIITSYHGGIEYSDREDSVAVREMKMLADFGARIVVGHHPHVPLGIHRYNDAWIFSSLGNFVFYQPQRYWTQYGIGVECEVEKDRNGNCTITSIELWPVKAGYQPKFSMTQVESEKLFQRIRALSTSNLYQTERGYSVELYSE